MQEPDTADSGEHPVSASSAPARPADYPPGLHALHPNARINFHIGYAVLALLPLIPITIFALAQNFDALELLALVLAAGLLLQGAGFLFARASFRRTRFALDADGLLILRGVIWRSETRVPRSRVQHTDINRGPIDRRLGLAELRVHTAGTKLAAVSIDGLAEDDARRLRNALLGEDDDQV